MAPGIDQQDQGNPTERPKGDPLADVHGGPGAGATPAGGHGIDSGLYPGGPKPRGGSFGGHGEIGSGGSSTGTGGDATPTPPER